MQRGDGDERRVQVVVVARSDNLRNQKRSSQSVTASSFLDTMVRTSYQAPGLVGYTVGMVDSVSLVVYRLGKLETEKVGI